MFKRFTDPAREASVRAQEQARSLGHNYIGIEHILLGLVATPESQSARCLESQGVDHDQVREALTRIIPPPGDLDAEALETIGIDLFAVRNKVEATFGSGPLDRPPGSRGRRGRLASGHIPLTPRAKKVLELARREALRLHHEYIADGHILLGLLREGEGLAVRILVDAGGPVPTQHGRGRDQKNRPASAGQQLRQGREKHPVGWRVAGTVWGATSETRL
jgi:ATP-dependent Clp protease ATP-binding subunit ClpA